MTGDSSPKKSKAADTCPECTVDLRTKNRKSHARAHWGELCDKPDKMSAGARERLEQILGE